MYSVFYKVGITDIQLSKKVGETAFALRLRKFLKYMFLRLQPIKP